MPDCQYTAQVAAYVIFALLDAYDNMAYIAHVRGHTARIMQAHRTRKRASKGRKGRNTHKGRLTMARRTNTNTNTDNVADKATVPMTDAAQRAAEYAAKVTAALAIIGNEQNAVDMTRAAHDGSITAAWLTAMDAAKEIKAGLFVHLKFASWKDYVTEAFASYQYATVNSYVVASEQPDARKYWQALGMGGAVSVATMMRNNKYSASEKKHVIALCDKVSDAFAATKAVTTDDTAIKAQRALESSRAAILAYSKELRKQYKASPASETDKVSLLKTVEACAKELEAVKTKREDLHAHELAVKARLLELRKSPSKTTGADKTIPVSDPSMPVRRALAQLVADGTLTQSQADASLKAQGFLPRPARGGKGANK